MSQPGHILVIDAAAAGRERVLRTLAQAGLSAEGLAQLPASVPACTAVVLDHKTVRSAPLPELVARIPVPAVFLVEGRWQHDHRELIECGAVHHVLAKTLDHEKLVAVLRALAASSPPAIAHWIGAMQHEQKMLITGSNDKTAALKSTRAFAQGLGITERLAANACHIVEELVTNAVYDAPVDAQGAPAFASWRRTEAVTLPEHKFVDVVLRTDGRRLAVSVADRWGTLTPERLLSYIAKGLRRGDDQVDRKPGGAGLGLYQVFDAASHLVVVLEQGVRTEVTALIEAGGTYRAFARESKSLNVFARSSGTRAGG